MKIKLACGENFQPLFANARVRIPTLFLFVTNLHMNAPLLISALGPILPWSMLRATAHLIAKKSGTPKASTRRL